MRLEIATRCNDNAGPIRFVERRSTNAFISNHQQESSVQLDPLAYALTSYYEISEDV